MNWQRRETLTIQLGRYEFVAKQGDKIAVVYQTLDNRWWYQVSTDAGATRTTGPTSYPTADDARRAAEAWFEIQAMSNDYEITGAYLARAIASYAATLPQHERARLWLDCWNLLDRDKLDTNTQPELCAVINSLNDPLPDAARTARHN
jgi:hypothetical protein